MIELSNSTIEVEEQHLLTGQKAADAVRGYSHVGFVKQLQRAADWDLAEKSGQALREKFSRMVVVGIGGSSLGARTLVEVFGRSPDHQVDVLDNIDARYVWDFLRSIDDFSQVCWLFVSKSGGTIETLTLANFVSEHLASKGFELAAHSLVITEEKESPLTDWAKKNQVQVVPMPLDVGGRYSVLTSVGMVPAAFLGLRPSDFQKGAQAILNEDKLFAHLIGHSLQSFQRGEAITLFWMYTQRLEMFGRWIQQLWSESLGKKLTQDGQLAPAVSTPIPAVGPTDQHSILQQVMEAQRDKFIWFFRVGDAEDYGPRLQRPMFSKTNILESRGLGDLMAAEARATREALSENGVQSLTLLVRELSPQNLGALFMMMEVVVAGIGHALNVNAFDQPGVERGKILAMEYLNR